MCNLAIGRDTLKETISTGSSIQPACAVCGLDQLVDAEKKKQRNTAKLEKNWKKVGKLRNIICFRSSVKEILSISPLGLFFV